MGKSHVCRLRAVSATATSMIATILTWLVCPEQAGCAPALDGSNLISSGSSACMENRGQWDERILATSVLEHSGIT